MEDMTTGTLHDNDSCVVGRLNRGVGLLHWSLSRSFI